MKVKVKIDTLYLQPIYENMLREQAKYYGLPCGQMSGCGMFQDGKPVYLGSSQEEAAITARILKNTKSPQFPLAWKRSSGTAMTIYMNGTIDLSGTRNSINELWDMFVPTVFRYAELVGDYETSRPEWKFWETAHNHIPELVREIMGTGQRVDGRKQIKLIKLLRNINYRESGEQPNWWFTAVRAAEEARQLEETPHDMYALRAFKNYVIALRDEI